MSLYYDTEGNYFENLPSSVSFPEDEIEKALTISPINDEIYEATQTGSIKVRTSDPDSGHSRQSVSISVTDNDQIGLSLDMPASVDEGDSFTVTLNRSNSEVYESENIEATALFHSKLFDSPETRYSGAFAFAEGETSSSWPFVVTRDDESNEGDAMFQVNVPSPSKYTGTIISDWTRIVDDDIPEVTLEVDKTEVIEGDSVVWTVTRDSYFDGRLNTRASFEYHHFRAPPLEDRVGGSTVDDLSPAFAGSIAAGRQSHQYTECTFGFSRCDHKDVTGPLGGYMQRRILPFPSDTFTGIPRRQDNTFNPRYTVSSSDWIRVNVINSAPGIKITPDVAEANEGESVSFTLTRFGGSQIARDSAMRVNVDVSQAGSYLSSETGSRIVTFPLNSLTASISLDTNGDDVDLADGTITVTLNDGATTGHVEDTYEFRTIQNPDGSYDNTATIEILDDDPSPVLTVSGGSGAESSGAIAFSFSLDKAATQAGSVAYETETKSSDSATSDVDYTHTSGTMSFAVGDQTKSLSVSIADDEIVEGNETFSLTLTNPSNLSLSSSVATATITDDDERGVTISETTLTIDEGSTDSYTVVLDSKPTGVVTITPSVTGSTDVTLNKTSLSFTALTWDTAQTVTVSAAEDDDAIADTATIAHSVSGGDYADESADSISVIVTDDEAVSSTVVLSLTTSSLDADTLVIDEGASATTVTLTGTLDGNVIRSDKVVTVSVGAESDSATEGIDYETVGDVTLTIPAGSESGTQTFSLDPTDDDVDEEDESISVSGSVEGLIVTGTSITITDNDTRGVTLSKSSLTINEGSSDSYTVALDSEPTGTVTVTPSVTGSSDITLNKTSLSFTADNWNTTQTLTVSVAEDDDAEIDSAVINHSVAGADYASESAVDVAVNVTENETASTSVALSVNIGSLGESAAATTVTLTGTLNDAVRSTDTDVTVSIGAGLDPATEGTDYGAVANVTLTIIAGSTSGTQTFSLDPTDDDVDEEDETITVSGTVAGLAVTGTSITIIDDDTRGVTLSKSSLTIDEGSTDSYTVVLDSEPTTTVTVTPSVTGSSDVTLNKTILSFTTNNWDTAQTVTVSAAEDDDAVADSATISHRVTGGDYSEESADDISVSVTDNETASTTVALSVNIGSLSEGDAAITVTVTGTLDEAVRSTDTEVTISIGAFLDSATEGTDYDTVANVTLTITEGQMSGTQTFSLNPTDDDVDEEDESISVSGSATGLTVTGTSITLTDNDTRGVTLSKSSLTIDEGSSDSYTVVLDTEPTGTVTITPSVTGSTDVTLNKTSLRFTTSDWDTAQTVTVSAAEDDDAVEDTATIAHSVSGGDYAAESVDDVSVSVTDNETASTTVALSVNTSSLAEGDAATTVTVTGTLDEAVRLTETEVTISIGALTDSATEGTDYGTVANVTLTINAGSTNGTQTFSLDPTDDDVDEEDESISVSGSVSGLTVTGTSITLADNDTRGVTISDTTLEVTEGSTTTYTIVLDSEPTSTVTITPSVTGSADVTLNKTNLSFTAENWDTAQTVSVSAAEDDDAVEDTATIAHSVTGGDYASESADNVTVTVSDNETASTGVVLTVAPASVGEHAEATTVTVTGTLNGAVLTDDAEVTVSIGSATDSATEGVDYGTVANVTLTITDGQISGTQTFSLDPTDDEVDEGDESISVSGSVEGLTVTGASITLTDDDSRGVTLSKSSLTIDEGSTDTYTVVLDSEPTGDVTVTTSVTGSKDVSLNKTSLIFTTSNWDTAQTVTVSAAEDDDADEDTATIAHSVSGADYVSESVDDVSVSVSDNETASTTVTLSVNIGSLGEGAAATTVTVTGTLDEAVRLTDTEVTVSIGEGTDSALSGTDYTGVSDFTLTIDAGSTSGTQTFSLDPTDDDVDEGDESISVSGSTTGLTVAGTSITITDDDTRGVTLSESSLTIEEGLTDSYTIVLDSEPTDTVTVTTSVTGSTDVTLNKTSLSFTADNWNVAQTVKVSAAEDDDAVEDTATISHNVTGGDYANESVDSVSVTVIDPETLGAKDPAVVELSVSTETIDENALTTTITVTGTLDGDVLEDDAVVTVTIGDSSDLATEGTDYADVADITLTIDAGSESGTQTFSLEPTDDDVDEGDESITVSGSGTGLTVKGASITITDDDTRGVTLSESSLTIDEGSTDSYTVVLDSEPTGEVTVTPSLTGSSEVTLSKSSLSFTTNNWDTAQTVTVSAAADDDADADTATITHSVSGGDYVAEIVDDIAVTVRDNDTASTTVVLSVNIGSLSEANAATIVSVTGTLDEAIRLTDTEVTVSIGTASDSATSGTDYTEVSDFTLTIDAESTSGTQTFSLDPTNDAVDEDDESISVSGSATGLTVTATSITITDDDTRGVTMSKSSLTIDEGSSDSYTVVLNSEPTGTVTVTPSVSGSTDVTLNKTSLSFTTNNWDTAQTVTVSAAEDDDADEDTATIAHGVTGADYASTTADDISVSVTDNETASTEVALSVSTSSLAEGDAAMTITVTGTLDEAVRSTDTEVAVSIGAINDSATSGTDYTDVSDFILTIDAGSTSGTQTFSLDPTDDHVDEGDESISVTGSTTGLTVTGTLITITDDDTRGVTLSKSSLTIDEGSTDSYTVVLDSEPTETVTVTPAVTGSTDVTLNKTSLSFTTVNWNTAQTVTVSTAEDDDAVADAATIAHSVSGGDYASESADDIEVSVTDNETASTAVVLSVNTDSLGESDVATTVTVTGTLDEAVRSTDTEVTVSIGADSDSATSGTDYTGVSDFTLTIDAGSPSGTQTFSLDPTDDDVDEEDESISVSGSTTGLTVTGTSITLTDDDTRGVTLSKLSLTIDEGSTDSYTIVLDSEPTGEVTVIPSVTGGVDVSLNKTSLSFTTSNWDTAQTVTVSAAEDDDAVPETATITHSVAGADYASTTADNVSVTVNDNETASTTIALSVNTSSLGENAAATTVTVTGTLDEAVRLTDTEVTVSIGADTDSATSGTDYTGVADFTLTINAGSTSGTQTFLLDPTDDDVDEEDESISILGSTTGLTVSGTSITLTDDDTRGVTLSKSSLTIDEGSTDSYTVVLDSEPTGTVTISPTVTGSTDVTLNKTSLSFTSGNWNTAQTVTVSAAEDDDAVEDTATIAHSVTGGDYASESADNVSVVVNDNETASTSVALSVNIDSLGEGDAATTVTVTGTLDEAIRLTDTNMMISIGAESDSATEGVDYETVGDVTLRIDAGSTNGTQTFSLDPADDVVDEEDETITVSGSVTGLTVTGTSITITDDDTRGVTLSKSTLTIDEGSSDSYTVVLDSEPTGTVTITPSVTGSTDVTLNKTSLSFTTSNWETAQSVTVSAAEDDDAVADTATIAHSVTGGDYASESADHVSVSVNDNETASTTVVLSVNTGSLDESAATTTVTVTGTLDAAIRLTDTDVRVSIGAESDSATEGVDYETVVDLTLTIDAGSTSGTQTFSLAATDDDVDEEDESISVSGSVAGLTVTGTSITLTDDDTRGVTISDAAIEVTEGSTASYTIVLDSEPSSTVTITPSVTGSADVTLSETSLSFTANSWDTAQTVIVSAAEDADAVEDSATITHGVTGGDYTSEPADDVTVTVNDNETASTGLTLMVQPASLGEHASATMVTVTGTLNGAVLTEDAEVTVSIGEESDSANEGTDYVLVANVTLTITKGQMSGTHTFSLDPTDDDVDEEDESISVSGSVAGLTVTGTSITLTDDDTRGVTLSKSSLTIDEGSSDSYTIVLDSEPTGTVTVTPAVTGSVDVTLDKSSLSFTTSNWDTAQTMTVSAAEDDDAVEDTATIAHSVIGGDYGSESADDVSVSVTDNETASTSVTLTVEPSSLGEHASLTTVTVTGTLDEAVRLTDTDITVSIGAPTDSASSGTDYTGVSDFTLTIDAGSTSGTQRFSIDPTDDDVDEEVESISVSGSVTGLTVTGTSITLTDDDTRGVTLSKSSLTIDEGSSDSYTLVLDSEPIGTVTVTPSITGSVDVTLDKPSLSFTTNNWDTAQTVTVSAAEDDDAVGDTATIAHSVTGGDYGSESADDISVSVTDNETASTLVALSVNISSLGEGDAATTVTVTGTLDEAVRLTPTEVTVSIGAESDSATKGIDYETVENVSLTINSGSKSGTQTFVLDPTNDDVDEEDESISVSGSVTGLTVTGTSIALTDDDTRGVTVSKTTITISEGSSDSYTVVLDSEPTGTVTISPSVTGSEDVTLDTTSLSFTTNNWDTAQTVTVSAAEDDDAEVDSATIAHSVSGSDYASESVDDIAVSVTDNETESTGVTLNVNTSTLAENANATTVTLTGTLSGAVLTDDAEITVSIGASTDSATRGKDYTGISDFTLTINAGSVNGTQTFLLDPTDDDVDEEDESLSVSGTATGLTVTGTSITLTDNDTRGVTLSKSSLAIDEGSSDIYTVLLDTEPTGTVTVTPSVTGSTDVTLNKGSLSFTPVNWDRAQTVTVSAAEDDDAVLDTATIAHSVTGGDYASESVDDISVSVTENETASTTVTLSVNTKSLGEGDAATTVTVTGTLDEAVRLTDTEVTVSIGANDDSATIGTDYTGVSDFTLMIDAGSRSGTQTFSLVPNDDDVDEDDELISVSGSAEGLTTVTGTSITLIDDDTRGVTLSKSSLTIGEGSSDSYTVVLDSEPTDTVTITLSVTGSIDVTLNKPSLSFTTVNWDTAQTVTVSAAEDDDAEVDSATIAHSVTGGDYALESADDVTVTVNDNETLSTGISLSVDVESLLESASATTVTVTGTLNGSIRTSDTAVSLFIGSDEDSATEGTDYDTVANLSLTIAAGQMSGSQTFSLTPIDDDVDEGDESISVLGSVTGLTLTGTSITITDNDTRGVTLSKSSLMIDEGSSDSYTIVLDSEPTGTVTVTPSVTGSSDVTLNKTSLSFTSRNWDIAQTVTVSAAEDDDAFADTATIAHSATGGDYASESVDNIEVSVTDDETASTGVTLSVDPSALGEEADAATVTVTGTVNGAVLMDDAAVTVSIGAANDSATSGTDYTGVSDFTLTINAGSTSGNQTFLLDPTDDDVDEEDESISVTGMATGLSVTGTSITLTDDDTRGVTLSKSSLSIDEGSSENYTVVLDSEPTGTVTVTLSVTGSTDVTLSKTSLSFTAENWDTAQAVTVSAAEDEDAVADTATITHGVTGADYASTAVGNVDVSVTENDLVVPTVMLSVDIASLDEDAGSTNITLTATLDMAVGEDVLEMTIEVGEEDDTATSGTDYSTVEDISLTIEQGELQGTAEFNLTPNDDDVDEDTEYITLTGSSSKMSVRVEDIQLAIVDNDDRGVSVEPKSLYVPVGGSATYHVVLRSQPVDPVIVTVVPDASSLVTVSPGELHFDANNWDIEQPVTVSVEGAVGVTIESIEHDATGGDYDSTPVDDVVVQSMERIEVLLSVDTTAVLEGLSSTVITVTGSHEGGARPEDIVINVSVGSDQDDARPGSDYMLPDDFVLTIPANFKRSSVSFTLSVLNDYVQETDERLSLIGETSAPFVSVSGTSIVIMDDDEVIDYSDFGADVWLARIGRTTADQVLKAIQGRLRGSRTPGLDVNINGWQSETVPSSDSILGGFSSGTNGNGIWPDEFLSNRFDSGAWRSGSSTRYSNAVGGFNSERLGIADLLDGASFGFNFGSLKRAGLASVWGHGAVSRFDSFQDGISFDAEVITGLAGVDWMLKRGIAGILVADSRGAGKFKLNGLGGDLESTMMSVFPWASLAITDSIKLTSVVGQGLGTLKLSTDETLPIETDTALSVLAVDLQGLLITPVSNQGFQLATNTDAVSVRTELQRSENDAGELNASTAVVTRLRYGLEGSWHGIELGTGKIVPQVDISVRQDDGDTEQGYGAELGAGLNWIDAERGLEAQFRVRSLLTHEDDRYSERTVSISLVWEPGADVKLGPRVTVVQNAEGFATGAMNFLRHASLSGVWDSIEPDSEAMGSLSREARFGYGFAAFHERLTVMPELSVARANGGRESRLTWRFEPILSSRNSLQFALWGAQNERRFRADQNRQDIGSGISWRVNGNDPLAQKFEVTVEALQRGFRQQDSDIGFRFRLKGHW